MTIFGKSISEYYQFAKGILGLIVLVGIGRLALSLGGVPNSTSEMAQHHGCGVDRNPLLRGPSPHQRLR